MNGQASPASDLTAAPRLGHLTLNAGSSSLKMALFADDHDQLILSAQVERIGPEAQMRLLGVDGADVPVTDADLTSHRGAFKALIGWMQARYPGLRLQTIGHRVVHGGARWTEPTLIDSAVLAELTALAPLAPLHQPYNLQGIQMASQAFPEVPQVACFDTGFHRQHSFASAAYALPHRFYEQGVRRYGFHGISYESVVAELARLAPEIVAGRVVIAHLGNGASMCAVQGGRSIDSTMGFSTLDGLPMGTRCGQIDPGVLLYLLDHEGLDATRIRDLLYHESGLLGLSGGLSSDMRTLEASNTQAAVRAIDYFVYRAQCGLGAMVGALGGIDALVFCGGIGEHSSRIRWRICERLAWLGIALDEEANRRHATVISSGCAPTTVMVIPTQEERAIAQAARRAVRGTMPGAGQSVQGARGTGSAPVTGALFRGRFAAPIERHECPATSSGNTAYVYPRKTSDNEADPPPHRA